MERFGKVFFCSKPKKSGPDRAPVEATFPPIRYSHEAFYERSVNVGIFFHREPKRWRLDPVRIHFSRHRIKLKMDSKTNSLSRKKTLWLIIEEDSASETRKSTNTGPRSDVFYFCAFIWFCSCSEELFYSVSILVPEQLDLVPDLGFGCWVSSRDFLSSWVSCWRDFWFLYASWDCY